VMSRMWITTVFGDCATHRCLCYPVTMPDMDCNMWNAYLMSVLFQIVSSGSRAPDVDCNDDGRHARHNSGAASGI
jgi:hypothetical protein